MKLLKLLILTFAFTCSLSSENFAQDSTMTVTSRGIGIDPSAAKKDAFVNAMQQAIGSYVDSETVIENNEIIKDKILSVSDGFVESYDVISEATRRDDSLYEIQIKATIRRGKMIARLKKARVTGSGVAGKDVAAEVITKIENAEQGEQLLEKHLNGLLEKLLVARLVGKNGKPSKQVRPVTKILADKRIECQWNIEVCFDTKAFYRTVRPQLEKVLKVVSTSAAGKCACLGERQKRYVTSTTGRPLLLLKEWQGKRPKVNRNDEEFPVYLSVGRNKSGENERFSIYLLDKNLYLPVFANAVAKTKDVKLHFDALDAEGEVVWQQLIALKETEIESGRRSAVARFLPSFLETEATLGRALILSPTFSSSPFGDCHRGHTNASGFLYGYSDTMFIPFKSTMSKEDIENITDVRFSFGE